MELLLWMWFYDPRWFFNFKISVNCYKYAWLIPFFIHVILTITCLYFLRTECEASLKLWLFSRTFSSLLISINIIFFMIKISRVYEKEYSFFENAIKIYPVLKHTTKNFDFWIRRKSLISTPGILLLFLGIISLFWSYVMLNLYYSENKFNQCDENILKLLNFNTILILIGNVPLLIVIIVLLVVKVTSFVAAYACPNCLIWLSKKSTPKMVTAGYNKNIDE